MKTVILIEAFCILAIAMTSAISFRAPMAPLRSVQFNAVEPHQRRFLAGELNRLKKENGAEYVAALRRLEEAQENPHGQLLLAAVAQENSESPTKEIAGEGDTPCDFAEKAAKGVGAAKDETPDLSAAVLLRGDLKVLQNLLAPGAVKDTAQREKLVQCAWSVQCAADVVLRAVRRQKDEGSRGHAEEMRQQFSSMAEKALCVVREVEGEQRREDQRQMAALQKTFPRSEWEEEKLWEKEERLWEGKKA